MLWLSPALAASPVTVVEDGDDFRFSVVVDDPVDEVIAYVRDPHHPAALSADGKFVLTPRPDGCWDQQFAMSYGPLDFGYLAAYCPTPIGASAKLTKSDSFRELAFAWEVRAVPAGTEVTYVYHAILDLPLPGWLIRRSTRNSTVGLMERLAAHFGE